MICFVEPDDIKKAWLYWIYIGLHSSYIVTPQCSLICINALLNSYLSTIFQHLWYKRFPNNRIQVIFSLGPKHSYIWTSWRRMMYGTGKKKTCVSFIQQNQSQKIPIWSNDVLKVFVKYVAFNQHGDTEQPWGFLAQMESITVNNNFSLLQRHKQERLFNLLFFLDLCYRQTLSLCFWQNWGELVFSSLARQLPGRPSETGCQLWALDPRLAVSHK